MCVIDLVFQSPDEGSCIRAEMLGFIKKKFSWKNLIKLKMSDIPSHSGLYKAISIYIYYIIIITSARNSFCKCPAETSGQNNI